MPSYDLYGTTIADLDSIRTIVESAIGISFAPHESAWSGGDYFRSGKMGSENFILQLNRTEDEVAELRFPNFPIILYVNNTTRSDHIASLFAKKAVSLQLLRHADIP